MRIKDNHSYIFIAVGSVLALLAGILFLTFPRYPTLARNDAPTEVDTQPAPARAEDNFENIIAPGPPIAALIAVGQPDSLGFTQITGAPGSVLPDAIVAVACLDTATVKFFQAQSDGSFSATIYAPPGTAIEIKHVYPFVDLSEIEATFTGTISGDIMVNWMNATPGVILRVPLNATGQGGGIPFGFAGTVAHETGVGFWSIKGTMGPEQASGSDLQFPISATLVITTPALSPGMDLSGVGAMANFKLRRHFDENGRQVPITQFFVSDFMTPTGLPISRFTPPWSPISATTTLSGWQQTADNTLRATISTTLSVPAGTQPGVYRPRLVLGFQGIPLGTSNNRTLRPGFIYGTTMGGDLPFIRIETSATPRLLWTLLTDTLNNGSRGTIARQDKGNYDLISLTVFQSDKFIIPRVDGRTGAPITYRLEPFLPLIALSDRGTPNSPLVPFSLPSGQLQVTILKPDGSTETLGPAPFRQATSHTPAFPDGKPRDNFGGAMQEVYQLTTMDDTFAYSFTGYGHYVITMTGFVEDIWGNGYQGGGVYDVFLARPLRLESGQLPATPYEVDNAFSAGLHVYPPVPAQVDIQFTLLPFSDPVQAITRTITGQADRFGYFSPPVPPIFMDAPGEYRVDVTAAYTESDGTLWMGSATWGNVIEGPGTPIIAHGRRGLDVPTVTPLLWFFHNQLGFNGVAHTHYPYFSGDVFWGMETPQSGAVGGDAILPEITIEDTVGGVYQIIQQRWSSQHSGLEPWETLQDRLDTNEAPLVSTTSDGSDLSWSPDKVDQVGYGYCISQRPGARVHEVISENCDGIHYWRFSAPYGDQVGYEGDLPNDLKWEFGGSVFRVISETNPINEYAIYGSLWVLLPEDDVTGPRVTPPLRGAGGPNGGPIMTLKGEEVDLLFLPRGVQPGDVLELGDQFSFSGHVAPPLGSRVAVTVTSPTGDVIPFEDYANKIGWLYNPGFTFPLEEEGMWTVDVQVVHDRPVPSTGLTPTSNNSGSVLGAANGRYHFYVVSPDSPRLLVSSPQPGYLSWPTDPVTQEPITVTTVPITVPIPVGLTNAVVSYTIRMPGFILKEGTLYPTGGSFTIIYDPLALHQEFPNLDLTARDANLPGLADPVLVTFLLAGDGTGGKVYRAGAVFFLGEEVMAAGSRAVYLPVILREN